MEEEKGRNVQRGEELPDRLQVTQVSVEMERLLQYKPLRQFQYLPVVVSKRGFEDHTVDVPCSS